MMFRSTYVLLHILCKRVKAPLVVCNLHCKSARAQLSHKKRMRKKYAKIVNRQLQKMFFTPLSEK